MASSQMPTPFVGLAPEALQTPLQPPTSSPHSQRPLRREGAVIMLSVAEQAMEEAMLRSSPEPEPALGKRTRQADDSPDGSDTEPDDGTPSTAVLPSIGNVAAVTQRYMLKKKLRPEQRDEVDAFLFDTALGRQAKLLASILALENRIEVFRSAAPPYQLSDELKTNIANYGIAVLLSVNVSAYKGNVPRNHVLDVLKKYRFDLPTGIEHDYANWEKISIFVSYSLTQTRSRVKKLIKESIKSNTNIFSLAQVIVHSTPCRTTIQLCGRVALMRAIHAECNGGDKYWDLVDTRLEFIRNIANLSVSKTAKAFNEILRVDRMTYGTQETYVIADTVPDEWQQGVDDVVAGTDTV